MARQSPLRISQVSTRDGGRQQAPVQAQIAARKVDAVPSYINKPHDDEMEGLLQGLKAFNPALETMADTADREARQKAEADYTNGKAASSEEGIYVNAYMGLEGRTKGLQDGQALRQSYETDFDKDNGDLEAFIRKQQAALTQGLPEGAYLREHGKQMTPFLDKLREDHLDARRKGVVAKVESNAMAALDAGIAGYKGAGQPIPEEFINGMRQELNTNLKVPNSRFNDLLFEVIKKHGDEGDFAIYDTLKKPRPDGTPGMYFIPAFKERVDAAQIHAKNVYLARDKAGEEGARKAREDRQGVALMDVFMEPDKQKAALLMEQHEKAGLFTNAADLMKWRKLLDEHVDGRPSPAQLDNENKGLVGVHTGTMTFQKIMALDVTRSQRKGLITDLAKANHDREAGADKGEKAIFKSPEYKSGHDYLERTLTPLRKDTITEPSVFQIQERGAAQREFAQRAKDITNPVELNALALEVTDRFLKRRKANEENSFPELKGSQLRFQTPSAAITAYDAGLLTSEELLYHKQYFKAQRQQTK